MTDIAAPAVETSWESKRIEIGRIHSAISDCWKTWEAHHPSASVIQAGSAEQVYMHTTTVNVIVAVDTEDEARQAEDNLSQLSDYSPSRLLVLVRTGRPEGDEIFSVRIKVEEREHTKGVAPVRLETITIVAPPGNDQSLASLSSPLLIPDLPDVLYVPYGPISNNLLVSGLCELVDILIVDSIWMHDTGATLGLLASHNTRQDVGDIADIAWARLQVWRQLVAQFFDQPAALDSLDTIEEVHIAFTPEAENGRCGRSAALLLAGWLATRLGWRTPGELVSSRKGWRSTLRAGGQGTGREIVLILTEGGQTDSCSCVEKIQLVAGGSAQGTFEVERTSDDEITTTSELNGSPAVTRLVHSGCSDERVLISQELRRLHEDPTYTAALDFATVLWPAGLDS